MFPFSSFFFRGGLHSIKKSPNSVIRKVGRNSRFFHSHNHRPSINKSVGHSLNTPRKVLWSYATAPSNLLFLTTNLIGLGIITAYRGLSTVANTDIRDLKINDIHPTDIQWDYDDLKVLRPQMEQNDGILAQVDTEVFKAESTRWDEDPFISTEELPLTEAQLDRYSAPITTDVHLERMSDMITDQLVTLYQIYKSIKLTFGDEFNYKALVDLPNDAKESLLRELISLVPEVESYEELVENIPSSKLHKLITSCIHPFMNNQILKKTKHDSNTTKLENSMGIKKLNDFQPCFQGIFSRYKTNNSLQYKFLIEMAHLFQTTSLSNVNMEALLKKLNRHQNNQNFSCLSDIISLTLLQYQNQQYIRSEEMLYQFIRSSMVSNNREIFDICLNKLNLDRDSLKRTGRASKTNVIVKKIAQGSHKFDYTLSLRIYITALKGLKQFCYAESHIVKAIKKVLLSLKTVGLETRVLHALKPKYGRVFNITLETIPKEALKVIVDLAMEYKDSPILKWCVVVLKKSEMLDEEMYIDLNKKIQSIAKELNDVELHELIEKVRDI